MKISLRGDFSMTQGGCLHDPGGIDAPGMYIVTFTAHQQRNMVRTPPTFLELATPLP